MTVVFVIGSSSRGVVLDFDEAGNLVGIDIDHASKVVNLSRLEAEALPVKAVSLVGASS